MHANCASRLVLGGVLPEVLGDARDRLALRLAEECVFRHVLRLRLHLASAFAPSASRQLSWAANEVLFTKLASPNLSSYTWGSLGAYTGCRAAESVFRSSLSAASTLRRKRPSS
eukprot:6190563-Pleurochrysis_carterae.AAC.4